MCHSISCRQRADTPKTSGTGHAPSTISLHRWRTPLPLGRKEEGGGRNGAEHRRTTGTDLLRAAWPRKLAQSCFPLKSASDSPKEPSSLAFLSRNSCSFSVYAGSAEGMQGADQRGATHDTQCPCSELSWASEAQSKGARYPREPFTGLEDGLLSSRAVQYWCCHGLSEEPPPQSHQVTDQ